MLDHFATPLSSESLDFLPPQAPRPKVLLLPRAVKKTPQIVISRTSTTRSAKGEEGSHCSSSVHTRWQTSRYRLLRLTSSHFPNYTIRFAIFKTSGREGLCAPALYTSSLQSQCTLLGSILLVIPRTRELTTSGASAHLRRSQKYIALLPTQRNGSSGATSCPLDAPLSRVGRRILKRFLLPTHFPYVFSYAEDGEQAIQGALYEKL